MITDCLVKSQNTRHVCHSRKACPWPDMTEGIYFQQLTCFWVLASADMNTFYESDISDYCKIILHLREESNNILHPH